MRAGDRLGNLDTVGTTSSKEVPRPQELHSENLPFTNSITMPGLTGIIHKILDPTDIWGDTRRLRSALPARAVGGRTRRESCLANQFDGV